MLSNNTISSPPLNGKSQKGKDYADTSFARKGDRPLILDDSSS